MAGFHLCFKIMLPIGLVLIVLTIGSYFFVNNTLTKLIHKQLLLKPNSSALNTWSNPPVFIYRKYYLFSVKNPTEVQKGLEKPHLIEYGPYVYREILEKKNLHFTDDDKLTYYPVSTLYFEPSLSNGSESDLITFVNIPAVAIIEDSIRNDNTFMTAGMLGLFNVQLFLTKNVSQLISGYEDPLLNLGKIADPSKVKSSKFSLLNDRNGTINHNVTIFIGTENVKNVGKIYAWNGLKKLNIWSSDNANTLKGTDGVVYPPFLSRTDELYTFNAEMCRSLKWSFNDEKLIEGVKAFDFHLSENVFDNATLNSDNEGFCQDDCLGNGVFNLSKCLGGLSMFGSWPHFLNADKKFVDSLTGLNPSKENHDYVLSIEPITGAPVRALARFQLNIYVPKSSDITLVRNLNPFLMPIFWIEVEANVKTETKKELAKLSNIYDMIPIVHIIALCIGLFMSLISIIGLVYNYFKSKQNTKGKKYQPVKTNNK